MAEANTGSMLSELKDITECSICTETFKDPRILPCIHTFCLKCMQQMARRGDKKPGDQLPCPICRKEINIAGGEEMGLQKNFFMSRLIEMMKICKPVDKDILCNVCLPTDTEDSSAEVPPATMYCIDCHDNLCSECSRYHRKHKMFRDHKVISLGSEIKEEELLEKSVLSFCEEHKKEQLKLYCVGCQMLVCVLCFVESHKLHDCRDVSKVADELRSQIIADISRASNHVTEMCAQKEQLEKETTEFLTSIAKVENEILRRSSELEELVHKSTTSLLEELSAVKQQRLKEMENKKEDIETHFTILNTFKTYCNKIVTKGSDDDVSSVANDLHHRADELQQLHQSCISQNLPSMKVLFQSTKLDPAAEKNIIGSISVENCDYHFISGTKSPFHPLHEANFEVDGFTYNCIEKYILHKEAVICNATQHVAALMKINNPGHLHKMLEKMSLNVDQRLWESKQKEVVKRAYLEKSLQYKDMSDLLCDTRGKVFVYVNPKDHVLGIGLKPNDPRSFHRHCWKGLNLLGEWLIEVQEEILHRRENTSIDSASDHEMPVLGDHCLTTEDKETFMHMAEKATDDPEKFTFFWGTESPFSQCHRCRFTIDGQLYIYAEQYVMHQKAVILGDGSTAQKILKIGNSVLLKRLGKKMTNLDDKKWNLVSNNVVKKAYLAKFGQNESLKSMLFETVGTTLVQANPIDTVWGIGLSAEDARAKNRNTWKGENRLGQILTEVREELLMLNSSNAVSPVSEEWTVGGGNRFASLMNLES